MKKRILSTMLMAAIMLSMAGCSGNTDTPAATEGGDVTTTTTAAEVMAETTTTTAPETEATTTTTEAPKEFPKITSEPTVRGDCMYFKEDGKYYVYNIADKKMYEYNGDDNLYGANGKIVSNGSRLNNLETQEIYDCELFRTDYVHAYNPAYKVEESFDGNTYYFGIIDKNGDWALPMSSDYAICDLAPQYTYNINGATSSLVIIDGETVYDYKNDKIINAEELGYTLATAIDGDKILFGTYSSSAHGYNNFVSYNTNTGEFVSVYENAAEFYYSNSNETYCLSDSFNECFVVLGENFEKLYEISGYSRAYFFDASENYVVFFALGADGGRYTLILDKDGNRVVEPISGKANKAYIIGDYAVIDDQIINCKTGETKTCKCIGVSADAGMIVVQSDGAYYLADPADPETLINPFEIAQS